jgi:hypothetical protein
MCREDKEKLMNYESSYCSILLGYKLCSVRYPPASLEEQERCMSADGRIIFGLL